MVCAFVHCWLWMFVCRKPRLGGWSGDWIIITNSSDMLDCLSLVASSSPKAEVAHKHAHAHSHTLRYYYAFPTWECWRMYLGGGLSCCPVCPFIYLVRYRHLSWVAFRCLDTVGWVERKGIQPAKKPTPVIPMVLLICCQSDVLWSNVICIACSVLSWFKLQLIAHCFLCSHSFQVRGWGFTSATLRLRLLFIAVSALVFVFQIWHISAQF